MSRSQYEEEINFTYTCDNMEKDGIGEYNFQASIIFDVESNDPYPGHSFTNIEIILPEEEIKSLMVNIVNDIEHDIDENLNKYLGDPQDHLDATADDDADLKMRFEKESE